jgi:hypothetical protein
LAARWRRRIEMASLFNSLAPILSRWSVEIFRLSLTVQKSFECIDLAGNLASRFQNLELLGSFDPRNVISYQCDPQKALPYEKPRRLSQHACKLLELFGL